MTNKRLRLTLKTVRAFIFLGALAALAAAAVFMTVILIAKYQAFLRASAAIHDFVCE